MLVWLTEDEVRVLDPASYSFAPYELGHVLAVADHVGTGHGFEFENENVAHIAIALCVTSGAGTRRAVVGGQGLGRLVGDVRPQARI